MKCDKWVMVSIERQANYIFPVHQKKKILATTTLFAPVFKAITEKLIETFI